MASEPDAPETGRSVDPLLASPTSPALGPVEDRPLDTTYAELSHGQLLKRLAASISIYTVGVFLTRFGALLLVPIYWRVLTPSDYGILAGAAIVTAVLSPLLGLATPESIIRFHKLWPASERRDRLGNAWTFDWLTSIVIGGAITAFAGPLLRPMFHTVPVDPYLRIAVIIGTLNSFAASPLVVLRVEEEDKKYVALSVSTFLVQTILILFLVVNARRGALGVLQGQAIGAALMIPLYSVLMFRRARPQLRLDYTREALAYSLPLVPGSLIESFNPVTDRFVLEKYVGLGTLGIYGLADTFASIVRTVAGAIKSAWVPFQIRLAAERADAKNVMARSADQIALAIFTVGLSLAVLCGDLITAIGKPAYFPVSKYLVPLIVPYVLAGLQPVFGTGFLIARKTSYAWSIAVTHLVVSLGAAVILVPRLGVIGAILASILGYGSRFLVGLYVSQSTYHIAFHWGKLTVLAVGALAGYAISRLLPPPPSYLGASLRLLLVLIFFPAMFAYISGTSVALRSAREIWPRFSAPRR